MSSIVIDDIDKRFRSGYDDMVGVAHVFCNYKRTENQRLEHLLATLLKQLAMERTNLPECIASLHEKRRTKSTKPSSGDLIEALEAVCASFTRAFVVVDAMDECQAEGCRSSLIGVLFDLQRKFPKAVSLFITSRHVPEVKEKFQSSLQLEIHATDGDLSRYAHSRIDHILTWIYVPEEHRLQIRKEITEKIIRISGGMFLLAQLCLDSLKDQTSMREIRIALAAFKQQNGPHALDHAYDQAVGRIRSQPRNLHQLATKFICWITHAIEPLTISELQHALAVEPGDTDLDFSGWRGADVILSVCAGLVTVDDETRIVRLIHFTTQEYFQRPSKSVQFFGDTKSFLSRVCVTYISFSAFSNIDTSKIWEFSDLIKRYPLLPYASAAWGIHAAHDTQLSDEVVEFLSDESKLEIVERMAYRYKVPFPPSDGNGLHWAAFYGILGVIDIFHGASTNELDSNRQTPLYYACQGGHTSVVQRLLQYGANPCQTSHMNSPLHAAAQAGDLIGATLLLDYGGNVDSTDAKRWTPLMYAMEKNRLSYFWQGELPSVSMIRRVGRLWLTLPSLANHTQLNTYSNAVLPFLIWVQMANIAAESGNIEALRTFMNKSSNPFGRRVDGSTCLIRAVKGNKVRSVIALIQMGCDVSMTDVDGRSPLSFAVRHSDGEIVTILLDNNAVVNNVDRCAISPLAIAVELGNLDVIGLLLGRDALLVNTNIFIGWAPEFKQLGGRMVRCKRFPRGKDISTDFCMTPLFLASALGFTEIADLLISYGANLDTQSSDGQTAMTIASKTGLEDMIKLLIAASAKMDQEQARRSRTTDKLVVDDTWHWVFGEILPYVLLGW
ncbi:ankyrin repeat protein [Colletotrichum asianum]